MIKKIILTLKLFVFVSFNITIHGQNNELLLDANTEFDNYNYFNAREVYIEVSKKGYKSFDLYSKIADSYYYQANFKDALIWYQKLFKNFKSEITDEYYFRYAQCLKASKNYDVAHKVLEKFATKKGKTDSRAQLFLSKKNNYLKEIENRSGKFTAHAAAFNTNYSEHSPFFIPNSDAILFSSSRGKGEICGWDQLPYLDLYIYDENKNEKNSVLPLNKTINTKLHESSAVITNDGKTMYFTRNNLDKKKIVFNESGENTLKLYKASFIKGAWKNVIELPFNNDHYSMAHPTLNSDNTRLYFSSDLPGSYGNSDIYYVDIIGENKYGPVTNIGNHINTEGRETFPFIDHKGNLYFASDGHPGLGGLDVFISKKREKTFRKPYNIGRPINSPQDDFSFIINAAKEGFFSSNREGGKGNDDIYAFKQIAPLEIDCNEFLKGLVTDSQTGEPLQNVEIVFFDEAFHKKKKITTNEAGAYLESIPCGSTLNIQYAKKGFCTKRVTLKFTKTPERVVEKNIRLKPYNFGRKKFLDGENIANKLEMRNIYFDLNKSKIKKSAEVELQKLIVFMKKFPQIHIKIQSHTDSRANDVYNMKLSEKRAFSTRNYLIDKGNIKPHRISQRGYGESQLINNCDNSSDCTEEEHALNRRSEFIIKIHSAISQIR